MSEITISKDRLDFTVDLLVTMVVEELSVRLQKDQASVLVDFVSSRTGKLLYDTSNRLWWNGPSYIADMYLAETGQASGEDA